MATVELKFKITDKVKQTANEMRAALMQLSGKEIRTLMQRGSRKSLTFAWGTTKRLLIKSIRKRHPGINPNKIARMIRRHYALAETRLTRPLIAITPDFSNLRNTDGKDLDAVFSGQDES